MIKQQSTMSLTTKTRNEIISIYLAVRGQAIILAHYFLLLCPRHDIQQLFELDSTKEKYVTL
jgi:hypothetical protein